LPPPPALILPPPPPISLFPPPLNPARTSVGSTANYYPCSSCKRKAKLLGSCLGQNS
jgi:hypothetical protein